MPITIPEIEDIGRLGDWDFDFGSQGYGTDRSFEVQWYIQLKETADWYNLDPMYLVTDSRMPAILSPYQSPDGSYIDPYCLLRKYRIGRKNSSRLMIEVFLMYSAVPYGQGPAGNIPLAQAFPTATAPNHGPSGGSGDPAGDLTQLAPKFQYGYETIDDLFTTDESPALAIVQNTALDQFEPHPTRPTPIRTLTYTRWEASWDEDKWNRFCFVTNAFVWFDHPTGSSLSYPPTVGDYTVLGGHVFYPVTYLIKIKIRPPYDWVLRLDNYGFREYPSVGAKKVPIMIGGKVTTKPWPLDVNGKKYAENSTTDPLSLEFVKYPEEDFDDLELILPS